MNITVSTKEKAWQLADKLFPTDYMKDEHDSPRAGYPVFNTTSTDDKYTGFHISDLNTALELNMGAGTSGQESKVFILLEENEQVEPINTLLLKQEDVKRKNQSREMTQHFCFLH